MNTTAKCKDKARKKTQNVLIRNKLHKIARVSQFMIFSLQDSRSIYTTVSMMINYTFFFFKFFKQNKGRKTHKKETTNQGIICIKLYK